MTSSLLPFLPLHFHPSFYFHLTTLDFSSNKGARISTGGCLFFWLLQDLWFISNGRIITFIYQLSDKSSPSFPSKTVRVVHTTLIIKLSISKSQTTNQRPWCTVTVPCVLSYSELYNYQHPSKYINILNISKHWHQYEVSNSFHYFLLGSQNLQKQCFIWVYCEKLNWSNSHYLEISKLPHVHLARAASTARARMLPSPLAAHWVSASRDRSAKAWSLLDLILGRREETVLCKKAIKQVLQD